MCFLTFWILCFSLSKRVILSSAAASLVVNMSLLGDGARMLVALGTAVTCEGGGWSGGGGESNGVICEITKYMNVHYIQRM